VLRTVDGGTCAAFRKAEPLVACRGPSRNLARLPLGGSTKGGRRPPLIGISRVRGRIPRAAFRDLGNTDRLPRDGTSEAARSRREGREVEAQRDGLTNASRRRV